MKVRKGFVSNSSSTSFVVMLPDDYKVPATESEQLKEVFQMLVSKGEIYQEEMAELDEGFWDKNAVSEEEPYSEAYFRLCELLDKHVVASLYGSDGEGRVVLGKKK